MLEAVVFRWSGLLTLYALLIAPISLQTARAQTLLEPICVEDPQEAMFRTFRYHDREIISMSKARGVPLPMFNDDDEVPISDHIQRYVNRVPRSALLLYAADSISNCAFMWTYNGQEPIYYREERTKNDLGVLNAKLRSGILSRHATTKRMPTLRGRTGTSLPLAGDPSVEKNKPLRHEDIVALSNLFFPPPFRESLSQTKHLSLVSIRGMSTVPVALLEPLGDGQQVVDLFSVNFIAFLPDVTLNEMVPHRLFDKALVVGNPATKRDPDYRFPNLPGAEQEAREVAGEFGAYPLLKEEATRAAVMNSIAEADLIYIAAHGLSDFHEALDKSFIALADGTEPEDGRLTARTIQYLDLKERPLVVLSACQTGLGQVMEAGVIGIGRAFQKAHAENTIMSLWNVSDAATLFLMAHFRKELKRQSPGEALRRAMLVTRDSGRFTDPALWAAFNVFGNNSNAGN